MKTSKGRRILVVGHIDIGLLLLLFSKFPQAKANGCGSATDTNTITKKRKRENVEKENKDERDAGFRLYRTNLWTREASNAMHLKL